MSAAQDGEIDCVPNGLKPPSQIEAPPSGADSRLNSADRLT
jgi:hypothetical protein